jgi:hypothetical protein
VLPVSELLPEVVVEELLFFDFFVFVVVLPLASPEPLVASVADMSLDPEVEAAADFL